MFLVIIFKYVKFDYEFKVSKIKGCYLREVWFRDYYNLIDYIC